MINIDDTITIRGDKSGTRYKVVDIVVQGGCPRTAEIAIPGDPTRSGFYFTRKLRKVVSL